MATVHAGFRFAKLDGQKSGLRWILFSGKNGYKCKQEGDDKNIRAQTGSGKGDGLGRDVHWQT